MKKLDYLLQGLGFLATANGKATVVSPDLSSEHLRVLAEIGLADCFYDPQHSEAVLVRRRRKSFPYGFHVLSEEETFSTKKESDILRLEEHAQKFSQRFLPVDREDVQHLQALSKRLSPHKLVQYLEAETTSPKSTEWNPPFPIGEELIEEKREPESWFRSLLGKIGLGSQQLVLHRYQKLVDALAKIEGTQSDVAFLRKIKSHLAIFTGTLGYDHIPSARGLAGPLALEEALERGIHVELMFGPYLCIGKTDDHKLEEYFGEEYALSDGQRVRLELTTETTRRQNGTAYINPEQVEESARLLCQVAEEAVTVSPILSDPARILLGKAFEQTHNPEYLMALNRVLMYRGRYADAAKALKIVHDEFKKSIDNPGIKSEFCLYLTDAYFRLGKLEQAQEAVQEALQAAPENHIAHLFVGTINQVKGEYAAARHSLERAVELAPDVKITQQFLERTKRVQQLL